MMTRDEFKKLVIVFGNASFDCGRWREETHVESYDDFMAAEWVAETALLDAFDQILAELDAARAALRNHEPEAKERP